MYVSMGLRLRVLCLGISFLTDASSAGSRSPNGIQMKELSVCIIM